MCFHVTHATRVLQSHNLSGEGINSGSLHTFLTTKGHGGPPRMSDHPDAGATSETAHYMKDNTHQAHTYSYQQGEYGRMITAAK